MMLKMESGAELKRIKHVQFGVFSPDEVKRMSVVKIDQNEIMHDGWPKKGGLLDPRLGTIDRSYKCLSCGGSQGTCPGHFGHIELYKPLYHSGFLANVVRVLRCVCHSCSKILVSKDDPAVKELLSRNLSSKTMLKKYYEIAKNKKECMVASGGCGYHQPKYTKDANRGILHEVAAKNQQQQIYQTAHAEKKAPLSAEKCFEILRNIKEEDYRLLACHEEHCRPEWMIIQCIPVPPPHVRPSIIMGATTMGTDDLTYFLSNIVKTNNSIARLEKQGTAPHIISDYIKTLQFYLSAYYDNESAGSTRCTHKTSGKPLKSIRQRLKGKEGRLRGNLMGKRVDFTARTVITGDPNLNLDEVGVPLDMAKILTTPETVTNFNREKLQKLVERGPDQWPGARYIKTPFGGFDLRHVQQKSFHQLQLGDVVERHIQDGDFCIFNRQPSLHKMSMMGHRMRILPFSTFRLNLSVTTPYNADFDGDEMNLHVPQSFETKAEIENLMLVPKQIVTPAKNQPVMGIVQDSLLASRLFTLRDTFLDKYAVMQLLMYVEKRDNYAKPIILPQPAILKPKQLWTGKQIFSMIIPAGINYQQRLESGSAKTDPVFSEADAYIFIDKGELLAGCINKDVIGNRAGSLIHIVFMEYGPEAAKNFFGDIQRVVNNYMITRGYTIGIGDTVADDATMNEISNIIRKAKEQADQIIVEAQQNKLKPQHGQPVMDAFESKIKKILEETTSASGTHAINSLKYYNNITNMVKGGSKGSTINIAQMSAVVAQQSVEGKRIPFGFKNRALPHFYQDDYSPAARGYVENSYLKGLTPQEFFFHAMGGREGLIDTAVKTSDTGYTQRRLVKAMEDVMVKYDGTVRNSLGNIVQFMYGEDGLDGGKVEFQSLSLNSFNNQKFEQHFKIDLSTLLLNDNGVGGGVGGGVGVGTTGTNAKPYISSEILQELHNNESAQAELDKEYNRLKQDRKLLQETILVAKKDNIPLPVNLNRLIVSAQKLYKITPNTLSDMSPLEIIEGVQRLSERLVVVVGKDDISNMMQENATLLFNILLRSTLASKRVLQEFRLTRETFKSLLGEIETRFLQAIVHPGEMVGALAAQSIGEPATQMTLNTFHLAGYSGGRNVTMGVPRLKEIINLAKNIKTPCCKVHISPEFLSQNASYESLIFDGQVARRKPVEDKDLAKIVQSALEYTTLKHLTKLVEIHYDPDPYDTQIEDDKQMMHLAFDLEDDDEKEAQRQYFSPWVLRLVLSHEAVMGKRILNPSSNLTDSITLELIKCKIEEKLDANSVQVIVSDDLSDVLVIRIRLKYTEDDLKMLKESGEDHEVLVLKQIEHSLLNDIPIMGLPKIKKVYMEELKTGKRWIDENGDVKVSPCWVVLTEGSDLAGILRHPYVDSTLTTSNDIRETLDVLGIEAARTCLFNELQEVFGSGSYINYRHVALLVETMTYRGHLLSISRHGFNRIETGPLMRCSFEETVEILFDAAMYGEKDNMHGVSDNVVMGQLAPLGTGYFDLILSEDMCKNAVEVMADEAVMWTEEEQQYHHQQQQQFYLQQQQQQRNGGKLGMFEDEDDEGGEAKLGFVPGSPSRVNSEFTTGSGGDEFVSGNYDSIKNLFTFASSAASIMSFSPDRDMSSPSATSPRYAASPAYGNKNSSSPLYDYQSSSPTYRNNYGGASAGGRFAGQKSSPMYTPSGNLTSPNYQSSPSYSPGMEKASPQYRQGYSPSSPRQDGSPVYTPSSPMRESPQYTPTSPQYSPSSPKYSPSSPNHAASPNYSPASPNYSPASPNYSPASPNYSPASPKYSPASPNYSPASPKYSPASPNYSPASPKYSPASPKYSPASPKYSPASPKYSPASPKYSPASPKYSPASPKYSPASPKYSPASPKYSPASPKYSPASPKYSPESPKYSPASPEYQNPDTSSPKYSPSSPEHDPNDQSS